VVSQKSVTELAAERQRILDTMRGEADMPKLYAVERRIAAATYRSDADRRVALAILLERGDRAPFLDKFKNKLFQRLQGEA
jgi:hypothetical protein